MVREIAGLEDGACLIGPKKDWFKPAFFSLFDFSKMKKSRSRLQKTNEQSF